MTVAGAAGQGAEWPGAEWPGAEWPGAAASGVTEPMLPGEPAVGVRPPRPEDADRIAAVHVTSWRETYTDLLPEGFFTEAHSRQRRERWAQILAEGRDEWRIRVAEFDGEIIGFAMAGPVQDAAESVQPAHDRVQEPAQQASGSDSSARELYTLYVLRGHQGTGVGQALLDAMLGTESGADSSPAPIFLWVAKQNPRAIAFYLRNGFRFDGVEKGDPGAPAITDARMVRP